MEEFRKVSSRFVISEPFMNRRGIIKAYYTFVDEVVAVDQYVVDSVAIAAIGAVSSVSGCGPETV